MSRAASHPTHCVTHTRADQTNSAQRVFMENDISEAEPFLQYILFCILSCQLLHQVCTTSTCTKYLQENLKIVQATNVAHETPKRASKNKHRRTKEPKDKWFLK